MRLLGSLAILFCALGIGPLCAEPATSQPAAQPATAAATYEISIDTTEVPELKDWADQLRPILEKWYPILVAALPSDGYEAPKKFDVTFKNMPGVAYTAGTHIVCAAHWFKAHPDDQGAVVHEMVHVVQQYYSRKNPGWLVEGIADYLRWFNYEPQAKHPHPSAANARYNASYQVSAAFLNWVTNTYAKDIVVKLNAACRQGHYSDELWKTYTGKTLEDLGAEWKSSIEKKAS